MINIRIIYHTLFIIFTYASSANVFFPPYPIPKENLTPIASILNESISQTESQIQYYGEQLSTAESVCYDYSGLYDHLYLITLGAGLLLISQFIMFE